MGRSWFVTPAVVRLSLSDGEWIDVRKRLSVGEERAAFQAIVGEVNEATGWRKPNFEMVGLAQIAAYVVAWSLTDDTGTPVPVSVDAIKNLDPIGYREIDAALDAHMKAVESTLLAEKNGRGGVVAPATTSPSVSEWAGPTGN